MAAWPIAWAQMTLARTRRTGEQGVLVSGDEVGGGEVKDEAAVHLLVEVEVEVIECLLWITKLGRLSATIQQTGQCDDAIHRKPDRRLDQPAPCARFEPDGGGFPTRRRYRQDGVVLRYVEVQSDSWFCSSVFMLMRS